MGDIVRGIEQRTIKGTLARHHIDYSELAEHLGVAEYVVERWDRGNLETPRVAHRLLALLADRWDSEGYKPPGELWGGW